MMIAFKQMYRSMGDQGFAILAGESFGEFCCCLFNVMNAKNCEHKASPIFCAPFFAQVSLPEAQLLPFALPRALVAETCLQDSISCF